MSPIMIVLAFCAGFSLIFAINYALADVAETHRQQVQKRLEQELKLRQRDRARASLAYKDLYQAAAEGRGQVEIRQSLRERVVNLLTEAGLAMRPDQLLILCGCFALVAFLPCVFVWQHWLLGGLAGMIAAPLPLLYVKFRRHQRLEKILSQLPTAFDLMSRTLRAGQTVAQSYQTVADECESPISDEFGYCYEQQNLGLSAEAAMRELARRTGLLELKIFVMAVMIQRQTGGNMSELLDKLGRVIRDRSKIRGSVKSLTAEGRMQAYVLLALPPGLLGIMLVINRPYALLLFENYWLLIVTAVSMTIGALWMRKIVNFDF